MRNTSIRNRRRRLRIKRDFDLQLTSMMDMLVIILVFLLKSYATNAVNFAASSKIQIPMSLAEEQPADGAHIIIDPDSISFDGEKVLNFTTLPEQDAEGKDIPGTGYTVDDGQLADAKHRIVPLYDALVRAREKTELMMSKAVWKNAEGEIEKPKFSGVVIIQADKNVRYDLLKKIFFSAGAAGFRTFKLVTIRKET